MDANPVLHTFGHLPIDDSSVITVTSTSAQSADASPITLNDQTTLVRLRLLPKIVANRANPANNVEGILTYEKRGSTADAFPLDRGADFVSRQTVKKDDALKLRLDSTETRNLYDGLTRLYAAADDMDSIPYGTTKYVALDKTVRTLLDLLRRDPAAAHMIADNETFELIQELLKLLTQRTSRDELRDILKGLEDSNLQSLSASSKEMPGLSLKSFLSHVPFTTIRLMWAENLLVGLAVISLISCTRTS